MTGEGKRHDSTGPGHRSPRPTTDGPPDPPVGRVGCHIDGDTTHVTVRGPVYARDCRTLREILDMAITLRPRGPIMVNLDGASYLIPAALAVIRTSAIIATRASRAMRVNHLHPNALNARPAAARLS